MSALTVAPAERLAGELDVPGDKAISHRALIIGTAVHGAIVIRGLSPAGDVASTRACLEKLGLLRAKEGNVPQLEGSTLALQVSTSLELEGMGGWSDRATNVQGFCGNSGSTMRMLMGALAGPHGVTTLAGDESLSRRPMERVAAPLRAMGARIELGAGGTPPVRIEGAPLRGIDYELPVASAQVKTAVLLAGLQASGETTVVEPAPSRDHTERMLAALGVETRQAPGRLRVKASKLFGDKEINIPGDFSSASFLVAAAAILPGSDVVLRNVGTNPTRTPFLDVVRAFGADVTATAEREISGEPRADLRVRADARRPVDVDPALVPGAIDELPLVAVLGCFADGETVVRGAAELRVKESDRIATIVEGLTAMGARIEARPDGFVVHGPARLAGATVRSHGDHRIAMALAIAALGADGPTIIEGWEAADVSYPGFAEALAGVVVP